LFLQKYVKKSDFSVQNVNNFFPTLFPFTFRAVSV